MSKVRAAAKLKNITSISLITLGTIVTSATLAGFVPNQQLCDIASQFRLVYVIVLGLILVPLLAVRSVVGTAIVAIGFVINSVPIILLSIKPSCEHPQEMQTVTLLNYNSEFQANNRVDLLRQEIDKKRPDVIALVEINQDWLDKLQPSLKEYPHQTVALDGPGLALFSKFPIKTAEIKHFGKTHHPRILATLTVGSKQLNLIVAHPTTPKVSGFEERNQELKLISDEAKALASPKIVVGDFNCTQFSPAFKQFATAGLHDSSLGFGPQPTWPARAGRVIPYTSIPPVVPIDHVLVSGDVCVQKREVGPPLQSDHLPVFVAASLPQ